MKRVTEESKKRILEMISTPGIEIEDISQELELDPETIIDILSDEYLKYDLDQGRRMCCRF